MASLLRRSFALPRLAPAPRPLAPLLAAAPPPSRSVYVQSTAGTEASALFAFERLSQKLRREGLERMMKKRAVRFALLWALGRRGRGGGGAAAGGA